VVNITKCRVNRGLIGRMGRKLTAMVLLPLLIMLWAPLAAGASSDATVEKATVSIQPEYDDPRILAIMESTLSSSTKLPRRVSFMIPKSAVNIQIGMACEVPEGQGHRCKVYEETDAGDFTDMNYTIDTARNLFTEYYWDPFKGSEEAEEGNKSFTYEYKAPYPTKELEIMFQAPLKAENFEIDPPTDFVSKDGEGFDYHVYSFKDVEPGQVFEFEVNYTKTDPKPSKEKTIGPASTNPNDDFGKVENQGITRIILFFMVLLITAVGLGFYWRAQMAAEPAPAKQAPARPKKGKAVKSSAGASSAKFCSDCGSQLSAGNKFCPECGREI
jgi:hypothetical protein